MRILLKMVLPACLALLAAAPARAAEDSADEAFSVSLYGWSYGRERKTVTSSNRVTAMFSAKNTTKGDLKDVSVALVYTTGTGEKINKPLTQKIGALKAGEAKKISVTGDFIPAFSGYEITLTADGRKEEWYGSSDTAQPQPKGGAPVQGVASVLVLGKEVTHEKNGAFGGTVRVKNEGTVEAKDVKITVTFFDNSKKKIHEWTDTLGKGTLAADSEANVPFKVPSAPRNYGGYEVRVGCADTDPEAAFSGGEFTQAAGIEFAHLKLSRTKENPKDLQIAAQVRNGYPETASSVKWTLNFLNDKNKKLKSFTYTVPGTLKSGEVASVSFTIPGVPPFEGLEQSMSAERAGSAPASATPRSGGISAGKFKKTSDVEVIFLESTASDNAVTLVGAVRNGREFPVKDIAVEAQIRKAGGGETKAAKTLTDILLPGEERNFVLSVPNCAGIDGYTYQFKFSPAQ